MSQGDAVDVRPAQPVPPLPSVHDHYANSTFRIHFCHPAYDPPGDVFLTLYAFDHTNGGIHHRTALTACGVLANNAWNGYFTETRDGARIADGRAESTQLLFSRPRPRRKLHSNPMPYRYPIVPTFADWRFPHENLPPDWTELANGQPTTEDVPLTAQSNVASAVFQRDNSCRISDHRDCTSCAHLCPSEEYDWFIKNAMDLYNLQPQSAGLYIVDDVHNALRLRLDLHKDFDNRKFLFVPKPASRGALALVTQVLSPTHELGRLYHNTETQPMRGISIEFLFARFAWTIFPSTSPFLIGGAPRLLVRFQVETGGEPTYLPKLATGDECRRITGTKIPSPKKRRQASREDSAGQYNNLAIAKRQRRRASDGSLDSDGGESSPTRWGNVPISPTCTECGDEEGIFREEPRGRSRFRLGASQLEHFPDGLGRPGHPVERPPRSETISSVWVDFPGFQIPSNYKTMDLPTLFENALTQLQSNHGITIATTIPSGLLGSTRETGTWKSSLYLPK
ncbi:MAG: hypothetical protein M1840_005359 [Geoglossum simile]|nr:MAG: hypothetical protein M1840_005359 [Geoglossum simile]